MNNFPKDPDLLYSYVNMMLRDEYESLADLCASMDVSAEEIRDKLAGAGYIYDETINQFR